MRIKKYGKKNGSKPRKNGGNSRSAAIRRGLDGDIPEIPMEMQSLANSWQPETPEGRQYKIDLEALINQFGGPSMGGQI
jgi:hypothetical protein